MNGNLLQVLLKEQVAKQNLSVREAARQIGIAHTTLGHVLDGGVYTVDTLVESCKWLGVSPGTILNSLGDGEDTAAMITAVLEMKPELASVFAEAIDRIRKGELEPEALDDIIHYAGFRLQLTKKQG